MVSRKKEERGTEREIERKKKGEDMREKESHLIQYHVRGRKKGGSLGHDLAFASMGPFHPWISHGIERNPVDTQIE
jgi:hypothetical protein